MYLVFKRLSEKRVADYNYCGSSENSINAEFTILESKEMVVVNLKVSDAMALKEGQLVIAELRYDPKYSAPWENYYIADSIKPLDTVVKDGEKDEHRILSFLNSDYGGIRDEFVISWLGEPRFVKEEGSECGFKARRDCILSYPHEMVEDEFFCSLYDDDVFKPIKEGDIIEAALSFQAYEWKGEGHQTIYASNLKKVN